jgi:poly-beta-1,6-N-acetyl-D-glucosamine synthase
MNFLFAITFILGTIYFIIILSFRYGWDKIKIFQKGSKSPSGIFISVIVPFRNEEKNIPALIDSISNQSLNKNLFELILVNDHSTDNSWQLAIMNSSVKKNIRCVNHSGKQGKKNAIACGIEHSKGTLVITTDADCAHHPEWLETIFSYYTIYKPKLIIGPVRMVGSGFFENFQKIDFLSLISSGAGASGIIHPIMCNGANLAFEKEAYTELLDPMNQMLVSGDDIFLLHQVKSKYPEKVKFLKSEQAVVTTYAEKTIGSFLKQRIRWSSKSKNYTDKDTIITALAVLLMNFSILFSLLSSLADNYFLYLFILLFTLKSSADFILLYKTTIFFKEKKLLKYFIPAEMLNLFIVPLVAITGLVYKVRWKGIKI